MKFFLILLLLVLNPKVIVAQSKEQKFILIFSEAKLKTKIDKYKVSLKAINYNSILDSKHNFKVLNVFYKDYSDLHYKSCQERDSIYLKFNYGNDTFDIDNKFGFANMKQIDKIFKHKKLLFSVNVKSEKIIKSRIDYFYVLIKCNACSGLLDSESSAKTNNDSVLLIKNNLEEIADFEIDNVSAYKIYMSLIKN
ncbi:hypothetical protein [Flavobacterium branchiophilum]|uniref:Uncharacterized protein n=1 Tax=Flavobacterium branchiophilum TaxID=55197 RepID=A0A2H3KNV3_9FLAO|nr:hypothetical protein [Flavobacterium branchiophilum]PDS22680.1 hypothetical protein B0A77_12805 [Flavobacterium branchiophilum]